MPALANKRQEAFCQLVKQRVPKLKAYVLAGYNYNEGAPYRLAENVRVKRRLNEITKGLAMKTRVTVETITSELDRIAAGAEAAQQFGAASGAVVAKAKLHGLLIDRKESGGPGDFSTLTSVEDVLAKVREELGDAAAALLAASMGERAEEPAAQVEQPAATHSEPSSVM